MGQFEIIDVKKNFHDRIQALWNKAEGTGNAQLISTVKERALFAQDYLWKGAIMFMGIGASWGQEKYFEHLVRSENVHYEAEEGRKEFPYYQPMYELAKNTGFTKEKGEGCFSNVDLTMLRETNSKIIEEFYKDKKALIFMEEQCHIALDMIKAAKPPIIIASNALVRRILKEEFFKTGFVSEFDNDFGTEIIRSPEFLKGIPIFFTSMLTGQRALDIGSRARLHWHINFVLGKLSKGVR
jgi:hypothetical protein